MGGGSWDPTPGPLGWLAALVYYFTRPRYGDVYVSQASPNVTYRVVDYEPGRIVVVREPADFMGLLRAYDEELFLKLVLDGTIRRIDRLWPWKGLSP